MHTSKITPFLRFALTIAVLLLVVSTAAAAADAWPVVRTGTEEHAIDRGPGGYLSFLKILLCWFVFLVWIQTTDWVNRDCQTLKLGYAVWNSVVFFPFVFAMIFFAWTIPWFWLGFSLLLICYAGPLTYYVIHRNRRVERHERVMTRDHVRFLIATYLGKVGLKVDVEKKAEHQKGAQVDFLPVAAETESQNQANLMTARKSPGYLPAKDLIAATLDCRGDKVMLDFTKEAVTLKTQIDGLWHDEAEPREREPSDVMLAVLKKLADLDVKERTKRQEGLFKAKYQEREYHITLISQGTKTGERVVLTLIDPTVRFDTLDDIGMRPKMQNELREWMESQQGLILFSSLPTGGLKTTMTVALKATDRLMRDFVSIEEKSEIPLDVLNVAINTFDASAGETPATHLTKILRREPDVVVVRRLEDGPTGSMLCNAVNDQGKLVVTSIRSKEAVESLLRVLMLKVPAEELAKAALVVVNQRLVRKLCDACKEAYTPAPEILKKLGIPEGRVQAFHRPPTKPEDPKEKYVPCKKCNEIGYYGRTSIFELLVVDQRLREALVKQPKLEVLRTVARKAGNRGLQEEGLLLVAQGITSLPELMRVLKQ